MVFIYWVAFILYVSLKECSYYVLSHFIDLSNMHTL